MLDHAGRSAAPSMVSIGGGAGLLLQRQPRGLGDYLTCRERQAVRVVRVAWTLRLTKPAAAGRDDSKRVAASKCESYFAGQYADVVLPDDAVAAPARARAAGQAVGSGD